MTPATPSTLDQTLTVAPERKGGGEQVALALFIGIPFLALLAAIPVAWGWGLGWHDIVIAVVMYAIAGHGITVGYHRHFTHGSFKASRALKIALAIAGSMAIQGPVVRWVADHRRHHAFSDRDGDPHSPWRYGETIPALAKGLWWAHTGWLFDVEQTPRSKYAPDLMADEDLRRIDRAFPLIVAGSMLLPAVVGGLWSMSWQGALTAFFWASLVRVSLLHHVTWSINSICHTIGERPFKSRDRSGNVWWLAVLSMGESWHNLHHADPTCARHGVEKGQVDSTARVIWAFERLGWATDVRWPVAKRIDARRISA
ncbi:stearoyl-CoA desaturase (delta-9 desaturase) [Phycicoccus badiiscoriae]|uniref:Stearoyl-CoA desaturase (Delta-9 desaturase) n=1 Tax=Pedococcus badiiscoriae TaxID=642776 RepID=A0A852WDT3_9MICO|nr:fatty acid desaturase [Pedococcus badiiscoriae]NYG07363.1 stearoyl-CoA desaturase (delta-9 desaturase) [Pedococcus badiiscoriae]